MILPELRQFINKEFTDDLLFSLIYGSYAYCMENEDSDLDLIVICKTIDTKKLKRFVDFVIGVHKKYGLKLDFDIPYENKILATEDDLRKAIAGTGFVIENNRFVIPKVVKTKKFLCSDPMKKRLLLNSMTTKSLFVSGNRILYNNYRELALENLIKIIFSNRKKKKMSVSYFVDCLIKDERVEGVFYLGYEDKPPIRKYLAGVIRKKFKELKKQGKLAETDGNFEIYNKEWFNKIFEEYKMCR
jgi:predicted nucleotidyltransferase